MKRAILIILGLFLFVNSGNSVILRDSFVEENDLHHEDVLENVSNISEDQFNGIIETIKRIYDPIAKKAGHKLSIGGFWKSSTVNAYCNRQYKKAIISVNGGLARRPEVTADALALVICHELGHAYGGKPSSRRPVFLISTEGQSDYYGAGFCLRKVLPELPDSSNEQPSNYIKSKCKEKYSDRRSYRVCVRSLLAGESAGRLVKYIKESDEVIDYTTPDTTKVRKTLKKYPKTIQCRLDTWHNGIFDLRRPACWFRR